MSRIVARGNTIRDISRTRFQRRRQPKTPLVTDGVN
ncbi:hypothetical protein V525_10865 [Gordonia alkanivorans CGMCC 6845]|jgi:hypothetical protein|uniref:Uncharacterized protein n=1 Tax=Gordonia alkanivorans CGMCC 6845 TaxID=1423140 RepID=W9DK56_9ACTN|nr:hypothetical protein V525_10865 [Gordonia alkanivorans CGMCC 6845]